MNFSAAFSLKPFADAISRTQTIIDRKSTSNILSMVLIESNGDAVRLTATDYDVTLIANVKAEIKHPGSLALSGKVLSDIARNLDGDLTITGLGNGWAELKSGRSVFKVTGVSPSDYPEMKVPDDSKGEWLDIPEAIMRDLLNKTAFAISEDETRMNLNGVNFTLSNGAKGGTKIEVVSTDGHRLNHVTADVDGSIPSRTRSAIIHRKGIADLRRIMSSGEKTISLGLFERGVVVFRSGDNTVLVRQIEDTFPDYNRVIPTTRTSSLFLSRNELSKSIKKVTAITNPKTNTIKVEIARDRVVINSSNPDCGESCDELSVEDFDGQPIMLGVNYRYITDVLSALLTDKVRIDVIDEFSPIKITAPDEPGATFIVMPMRT